MYAVLDQPDEKSHLRAGSGAREPSSDGSEDGATLHLMQAKTCHGVSVKSILEKSSFSSSTLKRRFRKLGLTPAGRIRQVRLEAAIGLLTTTTLPIKSIALEIGYRSAENFSDFFRRQTGLSPSAYRRRQRAGAPIPAARAPGTASATPAPTSPHAATRTPHNPGRASSKGNKL